MSMAAGAAWSAGSQAYRRAYEDPAAPVGGSAFASDALQSSTLDNLGGLGPVRYGFWSLLWRYYDNSAFENLRAWGTYKGRYQLYRLMRSVYNPTRRLVDFYAGAVYPGVLSEDGSKLPEGVPLAVPLSSDTPAPLRAAIAQVWAWSNWQAQKAVLVRYGAATGNVLVEVHDDLASGKVTLGVCWPGLLRALVLDASGNVKAYSVEYLATDDDGTRYRYRKDVDPDLVAFYRDDEPYDYGDGASYANPYGFAPAVWVRHKSIGGDFGIPAIYGSIPKIDELNSLASKIHDQIHRVVAAPVVFWSSGGLGRALSEGSQRGQTDEFSAADRAQDRDSLFYLQGPPDGHVDTLAGSLPLSDAKLYIEQLLCEIEQDHPEIGLYRELRQMSTLTGPAAARVMGDVAATLAESAANYDNASVKLFQMATAIGGWRAGRGDWGPLSRAQARFAPFDLNSYARGDLDFAIDPRPLVPPTSLERLQTAQAELAVAQQQQALAAGAVPTTTIRASEA